MSLSEADVFAAPFFIPHKAKPPKPAKTSASTTMTAMITLCQVRFFPDSWEGTEESSVSKSSALFDDSSVTSEKSSNTAVSPSDTAAEPSDSTEESSGAASS